MQIEHKVGQHPFELRAQIPVHGEARARKLGSPFEIENSQPLPKLPMRLGREIEFRWLPPAPDFDIVFRGLPFRDAFVGQVGNAGQDVLQTGFEICGGFLQLLDVLV